MENIFKDAYFGKPYKTRDGRKAVFYNHHNCYARERANYVTMILEGKESIYLWYYDGTAADNQEHLDIVSEWSEEITGEEYEEKFISLYESCIYWQAYEDEPELFAEAFKDLLDFAPSDKRTIDYCSDMIKSRKTIFNEVNNAVKTIISPKLKEISEEELDELAMFKYPCKCHPDEKFCDCCMNPDLKEAYKAGCKEMLKKWRDRRGHM